MTAPDISVVLPAYRAVQQIRDVVPEMIAGVEAIAPLPEFVVVVNGPDDGTREAAEKLAQTDGRVHVIVNPQPGWGRAVRAGLAKSSGTLVSYTNLARTPPALLAQAIDVARREPGTVVKANRKVRDHFFRRAGSLLYNLECRALLDLSSFDVNGTPKVFPAEYTELRKVQRDDDLIDAEFVAVCTAMGYPLLEIPAPPLPRHSGRSTTKVSSAWHMYRGVFELRNELIARGIIPR